MEYTIASAVSVVFVLVADWFSGVRLVTRKAFWVFLAVMYAFMIPVNGYLTWRPIVIYAPEHHLGIRVFTMPVEDFLFGFSLMMVTLLVWEGRRTRNAERETRNTACTPTCPPEQSEGGNRFSGAGGNAEERLTTKARRHKGNVG